LLPIAHIFPNIEKSREEIGFAAKHSFKYTKLSIFITKEDQSFAFLEGLTV